MVSAPPDAENQVYDAGDAPFSEGDERWRNGHVFRSLIDSNSADTSDSLSWYDAGEVDGGALLYDVGDAPFDKDVVVVSGGRIYKSAKDSNSSELSTTDWTDIGTTNRYRAFDLKSNMPSIGKTSVKWVFSSSSTVNAMILTLPKGAFANVKVNGGLDFDEQYRLTKPSYGLEYNHDFSPIESVHSVIVHGLPPGINNEIELTITGGEDQEVGVGQIAIGYAHEIGVGTAGGNVSASSLKDATEDEFGNITFPNRPKRRTVVFSFTESVLRNDNTLSRITEYLNAPVGVYMLDGVDLGYSIYGLVRSIDLPTDNTVLTDATLEVRGFPE